MKVKVSFFIIFIIISLILSFHAIPFAFSEDKVKPSEIKPAESEKPSSPETKPPGIKQFGVESQKPEAGQAVPVEPEKEPTIPLKAPQPYIASGTVSFFFDDADIFEVAQTIFGDVLKVNYIIDPKVKGRVNFRTVTPIPKDEVLPVMEIILRLNGIGFVEERGIYNIVPLDEVSRELVYAQIGKSPENVAIELFTFKNLNLKDSMSDIENALGLSVKGGLVRIMPVYHMNSLMVVASSKEQLEYIRKWIEVFDNMFSVARPKIFVYPVQNSKAKDVASLLQSIFGGAAGPTSAPAPRTEVPKTPTPGAPPTAPRTGAAAVVSGTGSLISPETKIFADEIANSLIILATPSDYEFIKETIQKIDIMPRQVMIEAIVVSVTLTDNLRFGLQWTIQNDFNIKGIKPFKNDVNISGPLTLNTPITDSVFTFTAYDLANKVKLMIQSLAKEDKAKILSSPHILVADNREAKIQVGDQIPIATSTTTTPLSGGTEVTNTTTATIQYKDTGTILKVKPQINDSGLVALEITQEVSKGNTTTVLGTEQFIISKREVTTNLVAQDGQTIVIGGLIDETTSKVRTGIPFLSRIPILGYLFGSTVDDTTRTELIILLTPHVVRNQQEAQGVTSDYVDRYKGSTKDKDINKFIKDKGKKEQSSSDAETKDAK
ncbi:MAG: secretin N-terminal domain-containing protein [Nitrospirota bacterium]|nr:secretin N-terminal domain-containing protein [Nitrospirota bacterium]